MLTPDFYDYRWRPLSSATVDDRWVILRWSDGVELRVFDLWLRENTIGDGGIDIATREGILDPADHDDQTRVSTVELDENGALLCGFRPHDLLARYHPGWLRHIAEGKHLVSSFLPRPTPWTARELLEPPTHDGRRIADDDEVLSAWIKDLLRLGVARLTNVGTDAGFGVALAARIGPIRHTNFGQIWDVVTNVPLDGASDTNTVANTRLRLAPHTDLPTRETPPGFQFLHCVENSVEGGMSTMADGYAVVSHIRQNHEAEYEALTTLRWVFFNRGHGIDHRWSGPVVDLGVAGAPPTLRAFYPLRAFPDMPEADVPRAYAAIKLFSQIAADDRFQLRYLLSPGDVVGFDNRRMLHGRDGFSSGGKRRLRGFYIDQDDVLSFARVSNRHLAAAVEKSRKE